MPASALLLKALHFCDDQIIRTGRMKVFLPAADSLSCKHGTLPAPSGTDSPSGTGKAETGPVPGFADFPISMGCSPPSVSTAVPVSSVPLPRHLCDRTESGKNRHRGKIRGALLKTADRQLFSASFASQKSFIVLAYNSSLPVHPYKSAVRYPFSGMTTLSYPAV